VQVDCALRRLCWFPTQASGRSAERVNVVDVLDSASEMIAVFLIFSNYLKNSFLIREIFSCFLY